MNATQIDPLWDFVGIADELPRDPEPRWCITCGPSAPLPSHGPGYCEHCEDMAAMRREDTR